MEKTKELDPYIPYSVVLLDLKTNKVIQILKDCPDWQEAYLTYLEYAIAFGGGPLMVPAVLKTGLFILEPYPETTFINNSIIKN